MLLLTKQNQVPLPPWLPLSFAVAKELANRNLHRQHLTSSEIHHFEAALATFSTWSQFMTPHTANALDALTVTHIAAFRVRAMLFEYILPFLNSSKRPCCNDSPFDLEYICSQARTISSSEHVERTTPAPTDAAIEPSLTTASTDPTDKNELAAQSSPLQKRMVNDRVPLTDVYHTLEYDYSAMCEQKKLEDFQAQSDINEENKDTQHQSLSILNADGNFSIKYLLQGIAANRDKMDLTDRELRNLLSDLRPNRSKWASDDKIGQEELYEALEKVLNSLKNYTEHSMPFLNKVSKRDAPDYFEVIERPMDLGTVTKKLKQAIYKSKKAFADDLYLIYENCLTYNTAPHNEYRKHAIAMRRKTDRLLANVPDIAVKDLEEDADYVSDEGEHDQPRHGGKGSGSSKVPAKHPAKSQRDDTPLDQDHYLRERSMTRESSAAPSHTDGFFHGSETDRDGFETTKRKQYSGKGMANHSTDDDEAAKDPTAELDPDLVELQDQLWRDMTKKTRAKIASDIDKQHQFSFGDRPAIKRTPLAMKRFAMMEHMHGDPETTLKLIRCSDASFSRWVERSHGVNNSLYDAFDLDSDDDESLDGSFFFTRVKSRADEDDTERTDLFIPEYVTAAGLPEIPGVPEELPCQNLIRRFSTTSETKTADSLVEERNNDDITLDVYPSVAFPNHGVNQIMNHNLQTLRNIRLTYDKCCNIRNNVPLSTTINTATTITESSLDTEIGTPIPSISLLPVHRHTSLPPLLIHQEISHQLIQRPLVKLLAHAGFEGAHTGALNVLTEIFVDYLFNIGKTIRNYWDDYGREMNGEEIILHTLYENGICALSDLESYITDDIERYSHRLDDVQRRLDTSYQDLLSGGPPADKPLEDDEALLQEDMLMRGAFGDEIGEDFFGFKELGLDKEYDLQTFIVPARLWHERIKYPPPPAFAPVVSEKEFIGLLQPVFRKKLEENNNTLVEDEYLVNRRRNRARFPPTNKINAARRKVLKETGNNQGSGSSVAMEAKKIKRKRTLEEVKAEKAEKKRQKMEVKAQKLAEKEQKRKQKEEMKEKERLAKLEGKLAKEKKMKKAGSPVHEEEPL
ncbi:uncharacterized protein BYT42DRAFT_614896 [Radiomyces spectabilis]|uniref:uncharacterized protein n=1 Tax=Radiomyces spectabilis TaxID=64574 RepID=UPI00221E98D7|nr:uncharacterized protein BYT42DRAFT_614896 [Radiomyces spectabilis]KAI8376113.1 hypothetical protein BYT42DRAFT_614896 [Radiomyces spectabilis]